VSKRKWEVEPEDPPQPEEKIEDWFQKHLNSDRPWLLAHADDGVIWGKLSKNGRLVTSNGLNSQVSPKLRWETLQQAFVFGSRDEVRLWREGAGWQARRIIDLAAERGDQDVIEESQVLWGTRVVAADSENEFTHVLEERQEGMEHIVPLLVTKEHLQQRRLKLLLRHFIEYSPRTGEARIAVSKLVKPFIE
jgi:CRISPR-associated protein (TIGR03984 family)